MTDGKEDYKRWVFEGNCPCCFPHWAHGQSEYGSYGVPVHVVWEWQEEFRAWDLYAEIQEKYDDED